MSNAEIDWINETVSNALKYSFIYERQDAMIDMWQRFKSSDYRNTAAIVSEIEAATSELNTLFRKAKVQSSTERVFSLSPDSMEACITDAYMKLRLNIENL